MGDEMMNNSDISISSGDNLLTRIELIGVHEGRDDEHARRKMETEMESIAINMEKGAIPEREETAGKGHGQLQEGKKRQQRRRSGRMSRLKHNIARAKLFAVHDPDFISWTAAKVHATRNPHLITPFWREEDYISREELFDRVSLSRDFADHNPDFISWTRAKVHAAHNPHLITPYWREEDYISREELFAVRERGRDFAAHNPDLLPWTCREKHNISRSKAHNPHLNTPFWREQDYMSREELFEGVSESRDFAIRNPDLASWIWREKHNISRAKVHAAHNPDLRTPVWREQDYISRQGLFEEVREGRDFAGHYPDLVTPTWREKHNISRARVHAAQNPDLITPFWREQDYISREELFEGVREGRDLAAHDPDLVASTWREEHNISRADEAHNPDLITRTWREEHNISREELFEGVSESRNFGPTLIEIPTEPAETSKESIAIKMEREEQDEAAEEGQGQCQHVIRNHNIKVR